MIVIKKWNHKVEKMWLQYERARNSYVKGFATYVDWETAWDPLIETKISEWDSKLESCPIGKRLIRYRNIRWKLAKLCALPF